MRVVFLYAYLILHSQKVKTKNDNKDDQMKN